MSDNRGFLVLEVFFIALIASILGGFITTAGITNYLDHKINKTLNKFDLAQYVFINENLQ